MTRNRVKYANVGLNELICNLQTKKNIHFEDFKLEESSTSLGNVLLANFQGFEGVLKSIHSCPNLHNRVEGA